MQRHQSFNERQHFFDLIILEVLHDEDLVHLVARDLALGVHADLLSRWLLLLLNFFADDVLNISDHLVHPLYANLHDLLNAQPVHVMLDVLVVDDAVADGEGHLDVRAGQDLGELQFVVDENPSARVLRQQLQQLFDV